jgi:hypothetical protein
MIARLAYMTWIVASIALGSVVPICIALGHPARILIVPAGILALKAIWQYGTAHLGFREIDDSLSIPDPDKEDEANRPW